MCVPVPDLRSLLCAFLAALWASSAGAFELRERDMRLVLAQIGAAVGGDRLDAVRAATPDTAIALSGQATWSDVEAELYFLGGDALGPGGLRSPLVVTAGSELRVEAGQSLRLDGSAGAFLLTLGALRVEGTISAAPAPDGSFRPFLIVGATGSVKADGARFEGLGFSSSPATSGVAIFSGGLLARPEQWNSSARTSPI